jgi:pyruvate dehydrogenase E2 component (dihydrolipoamide acetyltransferase)
MSVPVSVPKVGWGTEPIELVEWKVTEGSLVDRDATVVVITTKKIESEIHAEASGYLHIVVSEGGKAEIGSAVGFIAASEEELKVLQKENPTETGSATSTEGTVIQAATSAPVPALAERGRVRISPAARKMAEDHAVDVSAIVGTGPGGMIQREDVQAAIDRKARAKAGAPAAPVAAFSSSPSQGKRVKSKTPLRGMRAAIAENMYRSLSTSAQLTLMGEIDMAEIVRLREVLVKQAESLGASITYTDIFVFFLARVLRDFPALNSSVIDKEIVQWDDINLGVAVAMEGGLIVPVVRNADRKSIVEISQTIKALGARAREGKLEPGDVSDGTFTLTNLGARGGGYRFETVIINPPESAILGTGGISDRVVAREGQIVIRPVMTYYLTYDHRIIDGAVAAEFMASLIRLLENPVLLIDWKKALP